MMNQRFLRVLLSTLLSFAFVAGANAGDRICGDETIANQTIDENVAAVGACVLSGVVVNGNVDVEPGGSLVFVSTQIIGHVKSDGGVRVFGAGPPYFPVGGNLITGNYEIKNLTGAGGAGASGFVGEMRIVGKVDYEGNPMGTLAVNGEIGGGFTATGNTYGVVLSGSSIGGNVKVDGNSGINTHIIANAIGGHLKCSDNTPNSFLSSFNSVEGKADGQCEVL